VERAAGWSARRSRLWAAVVGQVVRRPLVLGGLATVTLLALAAPVLSLHLQDAGIYDLPAKVPVVRSLLDIQRAFPGGPEPAKVVVTGSDLTSPAVTGAVARLPGIKGNGGGAARGAPADSR
jgi:RND superfamily putative drug exporter